ncbi:MAG TPA: 5-formyltetrahydrofolate cyclo-ligase [Tepidisphaeraceae bacterium]
MVETLNKAALRKQLKDVLAAMSEADRHTKSLTICSLITSSPEFAAARAIMLYLSTPSEVDTAPLALRAWQAGKTVVVPKVSWDQRRMLPVEISSLHDQMTSTGHGIREPIAGQPMPVEFIDLVIVPGLGFTNNGYRIGRGMGFYDRFLAQSDFVGVSCGLAFEEQLVEQLPLLDHDIPLSMLATDRGVRRFASNCIKKDGLC